MVDRLRLSRAQIAAFVGNDPEAIRQIAAIEGYLPLLAAEPEESRALLQNLLVTVTSFFRDPQAFEGLKTCLAA